MYTQPNIVRLHGTTLKRDIVIGLLKKLDSLYNISFVKRKWVECLVIAE